MSSQARGFLMRSNVAISDIASIVREGGRTVIQAVDGSIVSTFIPLKCFVEEFPDGALAVVNKGIALACSQIAETQGRTYIMRDGRSFQGRVRDRASSVAPAGESEAPEEPICVNAQGGVDRQSLREMSCGPAFCSLQLVFGEEGIKLLVRYCSPRLAALLGVDSQAALDQPLYNAVPGADHAWFPAFADTAINGEARTIALPADAAGFSSIHCVQPRKGFCDCYFA